jgi:hypothetical protein
MWIPARGTASERLEERGVPQGTMLLLRKGGRWRRGRAARGSGGTASPAACRTHRRRRGATGSGRVRAVAVLGPRAGLAASLAAHPKENSIKNPAGGHQGLEAAGPFLSLVIAWRAALLMLPTAHLYHFLLRLLYITRFNVGCALFSDALARMWVAARNSSSNPLSEQGCRRLPPTCILFDLGTSFPGTWVRYVSTAKAEPSLLLSLHAAGHANSDKGRIQNLPFFLVLSLICCRFGSFAVACTSL